MRTVIQRVSRARVSVDSKEISSIGKGLCCLVGVDSTDTTDDIDYTARKICSLRIFNDPDGQMNLSVDQAEGDIMLISQFTLLGDARKGRRPSYIAAQTPGKAEELLDTLYKKVCLIHPGTVVTGKFRTEMEVDLVNHGPVTILIDSKKGF